MYGWILTYLLNYSELNHIPSFFFISFFFDLFIPHGTQVFNQLTQSPPICCYLFSFLHLSVATSSLPSTHLLLPLLFPPPICCYLSHFPDTYLQVFLVPFTSESFGQTKQQGKKRLTVKATIIYLTRTIKVNIN